MCWSTGVLLDTCSLLVARCKTLDTRTHTFLLSTFYTFYFLQHVAAGASTTHIGCQNIGNAQCCCFYFCD